MSGNSKARSCPPSKSIDLHTSADLRNPSLDAPTLLIRFTEHYLRLKYANSWKHSPALRLTLRGAKHFWTVSSVQLSTSARPDTNIPSTTLPESIAALSHNYFPTGFNKKKCATLLSCNLGLFHRLPSPSPLSFRPPFPGTLMIHAGTNLHGAYPYAPELV